MINNPVLFNDNLIMTGLILCCLTVLAIVMIPKAIRYRKQVKQNESENPVSDKEQVVEITIISEENMKSNKSQSFDYRKTFLTTPKLENRKPVFISQSTRDSLIKIARRLGDPKMSVSGFIENLAKHHLKEYADEINRLDKE